MVFGTDGIRGKFGNEFIRPEFFLKLGFAIGKWLGPGTKVIIGKDTRLSGYILESSLEAGLASCGVDVYLTGPIPTPAISYLTRSLCAQAGIVISASHNPFDDNGLKIFNSQGRKICDEEQKLIFENLSSNLQIMHTSKLGKAFRAPDPQGRYIEYLKNQFELTDMKKFRVALDCAHGALYQIAPTLFEELNAEVVSIGCEPNGYNINDQVGALVPERIEQLAHEKQADLGFSFDGDGDRLVVYHQGKIIPSEYVLLFLYDLFEKTENYQGGIIGTLLANTALESYLEKINIGYEQTQVGDRYLAFALENNSWSIAGEPSGHYLIFHKGSTADALLCALAVTVGIIKYQMNFDKYFTSCPLNDSLLKSFTCPEAKTVAQCQQIQDFLEQLKQEDPHLRSIFRASGTEPKVRLSLESSSKNSPEKMMKKFEEFFKGYLEKQGYGSNA